MKFDETVHEDGWAITAFMPSHADEPMCWVVVLVRDDLMHVIAQPMFHEPTYGPDFEDVQRLEEAVTEKMTELIGSEQSTRE